MAKKSTSRKSDRQQASAGRGQAAAAASGDAFVEQAVALHQQGRLDDAEAAYQAILARQPGNADALHYSGILAFQRGDFATALARIDAALASAPGNPAIHCNRGNALKRLGRTVEAEDAYRQALTLAPDFAEAAYNLGGLLEAGGRDDEALAAYGRAVAIAPTFLAALGKQADLLGRVGRWPEECALRQQLVDLAPGQPESLMSLGNACARTGRHAEALACYRQVLALVPDHVHAHANLGSLLTRAGQVSTAIDHLQRASRLDPNDVVAWNNLGNALTDAGRLDEATAAYRRAVVLAPDDLDAFSNLLFTLNYRDDLDRAEIYREHLAYGARLPSPPAVAWPPREAGAQRRVGLVSPDFRRHPIGWFIQPLLAHYDRSRFAFHCYHNSPDEDDWSAGLRRLADGWTNCAGWSDERLAAQVRADRIDILIDLAGHTADNRLPLFARRPAPIQASYLGYAQTTGTSCIDVRIADAFTEPPDAERYSSEPIVRLPGSYFCYSPPPEAPAIASLPARRRGSVTFGCSGNVAKMTSATFDLWAAVLDRVAGSRLVLRSLGLADPMLAARFGDAFSARGIDRQRVVLGGWQSHDRHLAFYDDIDIVLDTVPFNLATNACEALWMGVPVLSLAGATHAGRLGLSILAALGRPEWCAGDRDGFVDLAQSLAADLDALAALRAALRPRMAASALMDGKGFAARFGELLQDLPLPSAA